MAKTQEKINQSRKPRSPCFLCCFGDSRKEKFSEKISSVKSSNSKKETAAGLFSCSVSLMRNSSAKTVPVDTSDKSTDLSESQISSSKSSNFKSKWKILKLFTRRKNSTAKTMPFREVPTTVKHRIEETRQGPGQNNALENRKSYDHAGTSKDATCRKGLSFHRRRGNVSTGSSQPGSPDAVIKPNSKPGRTNTAATFSHSVSMPVPTREKLVNTLSEARVVPKRTRRDDNVTVNKFDPVVGMSIIVVTLVILFIWGRPCAILCTSAWLYLVPRFRIIKNDDVVMKINGDLDLISEEYKNRVVLEGFLDRDHRAVTAVL